MTTTSQATAAPHDVLIGDRKFRMTPLRDRDYGEFEAWVQDKHIALVRRNLDGLSESERERQLDRAFDNAAKIGIHSDEAMAAMCTVDGVAKLIWMSVRREQPNITEEEVVSLLTSAKFIRQALDEIDRVNHTVQLTQKKAVAKRALREGKRCTKPSRPRTGGRQSK